MSQSRPSRWAVSLPSWMSWRTLAGVSFKARDAALVVTRRQRRRGSTRRSKTGCSMCCAGCRNRRGLLCTCRDRRGPSECASCSRTSSSRDCWAYRTLSWRAAFLLRMGLLLSVSWRSPFVWESEKAHTEWKALACAFSDGCAIAIAWFRFAAFAICLDRSAAHIAAPPRATYVRDRLPLCHGGLLSCGEGTRYRVRKQPMRCKKM